MSETQRIVARLEKDNPWMVSRCMPKDLYIPKEHHHVTTKWVPKTVIKRMTAEEARAKGCKVGERFDDEEEVDVDVVEKVEEKVYWSEYRLKFRGKYSKDANGKTVLIAPQSSRPQKIREDLATAIESPLNYTVYPELIDKILNELDQWKHSTLKTPEINPKVLVLLGLKEEQENVSIEDRVFARSVYLIDKYSPSLLYISDSSNNQFELTMDETVRNECRTRQLMLFMPSNVQFYNEKTNEPII
jgi:hypothetical protein